MTLPPQPQPQLLALGDVNAFEMVFRTYYQPLCNYAYSFLQDKAEAEEVVQSVFLMVWEKREGLEIRTALKPYLYAMVRNACLNALKHQKVRQRHAGEVLSDGEEVHDPVTQSVISDELQRRIAEAMERLPEQCRLVFKMSRFEELRYADIARQLKISVKTVENHMGKALRLMREQLSDYLVAIILMFNLFFV